MKRKLLDLLVKWKTNPNRQPAVLLGARQGPPLIFGQRWHHSLKIALGSTRQKEVKNDLDKLAM